MASTHRKADLIETWHGQSTQYKQPPICVCVCLSSVKRLIPPKWDLTNTTFFYTSEKACLCEHCGMKFPTKVFLLKHNRNHVDEGQV